MIYGGVDLGGTNIKCALAGEDGTIIREGVTRTEAHKGPEAVIGRMADLALELSEEAGDRLAAVGIGVPGLVDLPNGITKFLPNLPTQWRDVALRDMLSPRLDCPVYLLNDVRAATLGELTYGSGRTVDTMAFFALGTGIGGGLVVDGRLRLGPLGAAGELGHQTVIPGGPICGCGNHGCLETLASGPAVIAEGVRLIRSGQAPKLRAMVGGDLNAVTGKKMVDAVEAGDSAVRDSIEWIAGYLGIGISNVITVLHPDLIILSGGVAEMGSILFDPIRKVVRERVRMMPVDDIRIEPSKLGEQAGVLGGIALAVKKGLTENRDQRK